MGLRVIQDSKRRNRRQYKSSGGWRPLRRNESESYTCHSCKPRLPLSCDSGSTADGGTIAAGGTMSVGCSALAKRATVQRDITVYNGGTAKNITVSCGGTMSLVYDGHAERKDEAIR